MSKNHNRWIVSSHRFVEHRSIVEAQVELERLQKAYPRRTFRLYRIKSTVDEVMPVPDEGVNAGVDGG